LVGLFAGGEPGNVSMLAVVMAPAVNAGCTVNTHCPALCTHPVLQDSSFAQRVKVWAPAVVL
jgi:hypothetical protein